ncbi:FecR family protein [Parapedobacter koreensis]|nr:FecR domain-containing protein [Parapedobacter koreensis]
MKITQELLDRYYEGCCTAEEQAAVERWLAEDPGLPDIPDLAHLQTLEDREWGRLRENHIRSGKPERQTRRLSRLWMVAASLLALVTVSVAVYWLITPKAHNVSLATTEPAFREYRTEPGQKAKVILPDGSTVHLNAGSYIRFPAAFDHRERTVDFEGEGYFSIVRQDGVPFTVRSGETRTHVLGTKFNLRAYPTENRTELVLEEGRVAFLRKNQPDSVVLEPGQRVIAQPIQPLAVARVDPARYTAWKDNRLRFDGMPLSEVVAALERWYGIDIEVTDSALLRETYSGQFDNPTVHRVLESLSYAIKFNYEQQGKKFKIYR